MKSIHPKVLARLTYQANGCLTYGGSLDRGYGKACLVLEGRPTTFRVHRYLYRVLVGEIAEGLELDHLCRNRACANPLHLEPVTRAVNMARVPRRQPKPLIHGTNTAYDQGCRCDECRGAAATYRRSRLDKPRACRHCGGLT